jgi:hypothetical protein
MGDAKHTPTLTKLSVMPGLTDPSVSAAPPGFRLLTAIELPKELHTIPSGPASENVTTFPIISGEGFVASCCLVRA